MVLMISTNYDVSLSWPSRKKIIDLPKLAANKESQDAMVDNFIILRCRGYQMNDELIGWRLAVELQVLQTF